MITTNVNTRNYGWKETFIISHPEDYFDSLTDRKRRPSVFWDVQTFWDTLSLQSSQLKLDPWNGQVVLK
jgi:hypothetical protein